ncbi:hypothetical protein CEXT_422171 [Caerostris extrusa]|uniref:Uncharacterized protein n=1 Tax=Caerostris extrusa TaxID=172846 RepID=A0AAV4QDK6_CAEEX|nr:hypothetical protein CEXT_422171 [Caerostris extrusa]
MDETRNCRFVSQTGRRLRRKGPSSKSHWDLIVLLAILWFSHKTRHLSRKGGYLFSEKIKRPGGQLVSCLTFGTTGFWFESSDGMDVLWMDVDDPEEFRVILENTIPSQCGTCAITFHGSYYSTRYHLVL